MRMSMCVAMFAIVRSVRLRFPLSHVATLALTMGIAGCSGELARFKENPFASNNSPEATGSISTGARRACEPGGEPTASSAGATAAFAL